MDAFGEFVFLWVERLGRTIDFIPPKIGGGPQIVNIQSSIVNYTDLVFSRKNMSRYTRIYLVTQDVF